MFLNDRQREFAKHTATGVSGVTAYAAAYGYDTSKAPLRRRRQFAKRACDLRKNPAVAALVAELKRGTNSTAVAAEADPAAGAARLLSVLDVATSADVRSLADADLHRAVLLLDHAAALARLVISERALAPLAGEST